MEISAGMVKELRDQTGAGIMDCRNALTACEGNVEKAGFLDNEWEALVRYWRTDKASLAV